MNIFRKLVLYSFFLFLIAGFINPPLSAAIGRMGGNNRGMIDRSNDLYSGNRFDAGNQFNSNRIYSGNRFDNNFYRGVEGDYSYQNVVPVAPVYGYGYYDPNYDAFPDQTEANNLYWGEVQQMESQ